MIQTFKMIGQAEDRLALRRGITADALEHRRAVMQRMRHDMGGCFSPGLYASVVPDIRRIFLGHDFGSLKGMRSVAGEPALGKSVACFAPNEPTNDDGSNDYTRHIAGPAVSAHCLAVFERRACRCVRLSGCDGAVRHGTGADEADSSGTERLRCRDRDVELLARRLVSLATVLAVRRDIDTGRADRRCNHVAGYLLSTLGRRGAGLCRRALAVAAGAWRQHTKLTIAA